MVLIRDRSGYSSPGLFPLENGGEIPGDEVDGMSGSVKLRFISNSCFLVVFSFSIFTMQGMHQCQKSQTFQPSRFVVLSPTPLILNRFSRFNMKF